MKVLVGVWLFASGFFFIGCTTPPKMDRFEKEQDVFDIDFSFYSKNGFLITPHQYLGDYESVGFVGSTHFPAGSAVTIKPKGFELSGAYDKIEWKVELPNPKEMVDSMVSRATALGANALIDFKVFDTAFVYEGQITYNIPEVRVRGYKATGFAIKRLGAFKAAQ